MGKIKWAFARKGDTMSSLENINQTEYKQPLNMFNADDSNDNNNIDDNDNDNDPPVGKGLKAAIMALIATIMKNLKAGMDVSSDMNKLLNMLQSFGGNVVGQDAEAQKQLTKYLSGVSNIQGIINDENGAPQQDIDPYSGQKVLNQDGSARMVSPEEALQHQLQYLLNDPQTKYKMQDDGSGHPKLIEPKMLNPSYAFFQAHPELYDEMKSNLSNLVSSLKNKDGSCPSIDNEPAGYNVLPDGTISPGTNIQSGSFPYDPTPNQNSYEGGAIENMWEKANQPIDPSTGAKPDPTILNQVMSAVGSINQSYTSASSAEQTVAQADIQTFNTEQGIFNKFLQAENSVIKALVAGQKPN
jgi:hypothetical protein